MSESASNFRLGRFVETPIAGEIVRAFVPPSLPPEPAVDYAGPPGAIKSGRTRLGASGRHHHAAAASRAVLRSCLTITFPPVAKALLSHSGLSSAYWKYSLQAFQRSSGVAKIGFRPWLLRAIQNLLPLGAAIIYLADLSGCFNCVDCRTKFSHSHAVQFSRAGKAYGVRHGSSFRAQHQFY